jgi:hypothetical protein
MLIIRHVLLVSAFALTVAGAAFATDSVENECVPPDSTPVSPIRPTPPEQCATGRNLRGWEAGYNVGRAQVGRLWNSLGQDPDRYDELVGLSLSTITPVVTTYLTPGVTPYTRCRAQGYLDATVYAIQQLNPIECVIDGADWGTVMGQIYCSVAVQLDGVSTGPLLIRVPTGVCGQYFETTCDAVFTYVATDGSATIEEGIAACLEDAGLDLSSLPYADNFGEACTPYTTGTHEAAFAAALQTDCAYAGAEP